MNNTDKDTAAIESNTSGGTKSRRFLKNKWLRLAFGISMGALAGTLYWNFIGCNGGTCPLVSSPTKTVLLFSFLGAWISFK